MLDAKNAYYLVEILQLDRQLMFSQSLHQVVRQTQPCVHLVMRGGICLSMMKLGPACLVIFLVRPVMAKVPINVYTVMMTESGLLQKLIAYLDSIVCVNQTQ